MALKDLREYISVLEKEEELCRVKAEVDWNLELGGVTRKVMNNKGPALLFENIKGHNHPEARGRRMVTATMGKSKRLSYWLGLPRETPMGEMIKIVKERFKETIKPRLLSTGPVKENILSGDDIDLNEFPAPVWHHRDGGRYFMTSCITVTKDPDTGIVNAGTYRGMVLGKNKIGVLLAPVQHWGIHYQKYAERGQDMPVSVVIGLDPAVRFMGSVPLPYGACEYDVAGAVKGEPVELVKCETNDLLVPAHAEIVVEGTISPDPKLWEMEGPFGEYTGYYGGIASLRPVINVKCITHRNDPIFESVCEGWGPQFPNESAIMIELSGSALVWNILDRIGIPEILDVYVLPTSRVTTVAVRIRKRYYGHAKQVAAALWGSPLPYMGKFVIVVDEDIDIHDLEAIEWAIAYRVNPDPAGTDIVFYPGTLGSMLDPSIPAKQRHLQGKPMARWNRMLIDATKSFELEPQEQYGGDVYPPKAFEISEDTEKLIEKRWKEYGIPE